MSSFNVLKKSSAAIGSDAAYRIYLLYAYIHIMSMCQKQTILASGCFYDVLFVEIKRNIAGQ
jgi:hypothetical protein